MPANMFIYLTHGTKAIVKFLAKNIDKALTATNSQATIALTVILKKEKNTKTSEETLLYYVESIQLHGETNPTAVSREGFTLPAFIQYIEDLKVNHHVLNDHMMLCCDGNLGEPGAPDVTPELCCLISDGQQAPLGINPGQIVLFSSTSTCRDDSKTYLNGRPSNLGYIRPEYLLTGRVLESTSSALKEDVTSMIDEPLSFSLTQSRHSTASPSASEISRASPTESAHEIQQEQIQVTKSTPYSSTPRPWYSIFSCCPSTAAVIQPGDQAEKPLKAQIKATNDFK
jgi:hypothetical protein